MTRSESLMLAIIVGLIVFIAIAVMTVPGLAEAVMYAAHTSGELNVRDAAGYDGQKIGYLMPGDAVGFVEHKHGWTLVTCGVEAGKGWVKTEYLTTDLDGAGEYVNTSGGRVRLRDAPDGKGIGWVKAGATVSVSGWVVDSDGREWGCTKSGYVARECFEGAVDGNDP